MAITIRTILLRDGVATVQAGAGIVADSVPEAERQESENKARALLVALDLAERGTVMILLIDNYDSFTYNLYQYLGELGAAVRVVRNDAIAPDAVAGRGRGGPDHLAGPGRRRTRRGFRWRPSRRWPACARCWASASATSASGRLYGGRIVRAPAPVHGKTSAIYHDGQGVFAGLPNPFQATRYHSLVIDRETCPADLEITAWTEDGLIMGVRHRRHAVEGVQFHPESIMTEDGKQLLGNYLAMLDN